MSAPRSSGRWRAGVANVLSTSVRAPAFFASAAIAARSATFRSGLDGDSTRTSFVSGRIAFATAARSSIGQNVAVRPHAGKNSCPTARQP